MMRAGTSRDELLSSYATAQLDGASGDYYADDDAHSKSHHQQYSDFIRSSMYKNDSQRMTCTSCHSARELEFDRQLLADPTDMEGLCGGACHAANVSDPVTHMNAQLGAGMGSLMSAAICTDCHMPKTAKTGAGEPGITIGTTQHWQNDVSSHLFAVPDKAWSDTSGQSMPTPYTNSCAGSCHTSL